MNDAWGGRAGTTTRRCWVAAPTGPLTQSSVREVAGTGEVRWALGPGASSQRPSPSRSQDSSSNVPLEVEVKVTVSPECGSSGSTVKDATAGGAAWAAGAAARAAKDRTAASSNRIAGPTVQPSAPKVGE